MCCIIKYQNKNTKEIRIRKKLQTKKTKGINNNRKRVQKYIKVCLFVTEDRRVSFQNSILGKLIVFSLNSK